MDYIMDFFEGTNHREPDPRANRPMNSTAQATNPSDQNRKKHPGHRSDEGNYSTRNFHNQGMGHLRSEQIHTSSNNHGPANTSNQSGRNEYCGALSHPPAGTQDSAKMSGVKSFYSSLKGMFKSTPIPQSSLVDIEEGDFAREVIYRQAVQRTSQVPHIVKFDDPKHIICGIACTPKDEKTPSSEAEVIRGGIGHNFIQIRLQPTTKGYWACAIEILGRAYK